MRADRLRDLSELRVPGPDRERFAGFNEALAALERAALEELATLDRALLELLLQEFDGAYREAKAAESALDFEDLQLLARELLQGNETVREAAGIQGTPTLQITIGDAEPYEIQVASIDQLRAALDDALDG